MRHAVAASLVAVSMMACAGDTRTASERAVRAVWHEYLTSKQGQFAAQAGTPSPLWNAAEQARWPMYDLAGFYLPDHAVPEVVSITRVNAAVDTAYQIVTRFWPPSATPRDSSSKPVLTMTVYARRDRTRWELVNALSFKTSRWVRESRGRIAYRVAPSLRFDESTALRAATFVDSLAAAFELPPPDTIEYFVAASVDQALEILGVVMPQRFEAAGGFAKPVNNQVFSGIPALGENYRHELAHVVLLPVIRGSSTSLLASEGVSTWLGGTAGGDYHESVRRLAERLAAQPHLDLDVIVSDVRVSSDIRNATGAVLAEMVHESGGVGAVSEYLRMPGSPHAMRAGLESILHRPWPTIVTEWRRYVSRIAAH